MAGTRVASAHNAKPIPFDDRFMNNTHNIHDKRLADAWATLQSHSDRGLPLDPDPSRLAFADPEFLLRRETRGIRMQLELMKPDLEQRAHGIENTVVVFGSARFRSEDEAAALVAQAEAAGDTALAERWRRLSRNSHYYEKARTFGKLVAQYSEKKDCTYSYFADPMYVCMDADYNQYEVEAENMGDALNYLEDGMAVEVVFYLSLIHI